MSAVIVLAASVLQACTGFGFSVLATPFLLLIHEPHAAIQINIILSLLISVVMVPRIAKAADKALLKRLIIGSTLGAPVGLLVYLTLDTDWLRITVSLIILLLTALMLCKVTVRKTPRRDHVAGGLSGLLSASIGMPGPPVLLYFAGARIDKFVLRGTTLAAFLYIYLIALVLQLVFGSTNWSIWITALTLVPVTLLGTWMGEKLFYVVSQALFRQMTYAILLVTGLYLLYTSL